MHTECLRAQECLITTETSHKRIGKTLSGLYAMDFDGGHKRYSQQLYGVINLLQELLYFLVELDTLILFSLSQCITSNRHTVKRE